MVQLEEKAMSHRRNADATTGHELTYASTAAGIIDNARYDVGRRESFRGDRVAQAGVEDLAQLAASERWEDRVRAEVLRQHLTITLPDQFPCIYEAPDSPRQPQPGYGNRQPFVWVASPDLDMLRALLPDYQELWDAYTAQWGPSSRRTFAVGRLDGVTPHRVYRPGTSPQEVIGDTMLTHSSMYRWQNPRLREMHPQHESWTRTKTNR